MSEKKRFSSEVLTDHEPGKKTPEGDLAKIDVADVENNHSELLDHARVEVASNSEANDRERILKELHTDHASEAEEREIEQRPINSALKHLTFEREIRHIRRSLGKTDRIGSRIIHQPAIRSISEVSAKTLTRPSGLLGGGIVAFLGTGTYLYLTKHIGIKYNYSMFFFLLIVGFILGLLIESLIRLSRHRKTL